MPEKPETQPLAGFRSLAVTIAASFLALSLGILLLSTSLNLYFSFREQQQSIRSQQKLIAKDAADTVRDFISEKFRTLEQAIDINDIVATPELRALVMNKLIGRDASLRQLFLLGADGQILQKASRLSNTTENPLDRLEKSVLQDAFQGRQYISPIYIDVETSEPLILIALPANNIFHEPEGVFVAEVNLKFMWDLVSQIQVGQKGTAYVVDEHGHLIAFSDIGRVLQHEDLGALKEVSQFQAGIIDSANDISRGIQGTYVVSSFVPLGTPVWAVMVELPLQEAYRPIITIIVISLAILLLSSLVIVVVGIYIAKKITEPLQTLRDAAIQISQGVFGKKITIVANNEMGQLAQAFNEMSAELQVSRTDLEKRVAEKTEALQKTVEEIERTNSLMIGRELKMRELKKEIKELKNKIGGL